MTKRRSKTRPPYEDYGVSRLQIERDWDQWQAWGLIDELEIEAAMVRTACHDTQFDGIPKDGWEYIARELHIIHFQLPQAKTEESLSRLQMAKKCLDLADQIWEIGREMGEMAWQEDFTMAAIEAKNSAADGKPFEFVNLPNRITELVGPMKKFAFFLELSSNWQTRKIRPASERQRRLVLACKLKPIFEEQFSLEAKLKGGSASRPIEEESPWAKFFQAAAIVTLGERSTIDRQGVLIEARRPVA